MEQIRIGDIAHTATGWGLLRGRLPASLCLRLHGASLRVRHVGPLRFLWCSACEAIR